MAVEEKHGLYFEEFGPAEAPALVFLHGGGIAGWMWQQQVDYFKSNYHVLVPDLPEQGRSTAAAPYSTEFAADCVADLIREHAAAGRAHVVGLSEGAQVLVALLSRHPEVVDHAVSSSAILRAMPGQALYSRALFRFSYRWFMLPFKNNDWWIRVNMKNAAGVPDEFFPQFKRSFQETTEGGLVNVMYEAMHFRLPPNLQNARVPVLVVVGNLEYPQMIASARDLLAGLPQARGVKVSLGRGSSLAKEHNWALTAPDFFNQTVSAWIEGRPLPPALLPLTAETN